MNRHGKSNYTGTAMPSIKKKKIKRNRDQAFPLPLDKRRLLLGLIRGAAKHCHATAAAVHALKLGVGQPQEGDPPHDRRGREKEGQNADRGGQRAGRV